MKKLREKLSFFIKIALPIRIMFIIGIFFIVLGTILVIMSFRNEVLDGSYVITDITEYKNEPLENLSKGEIRAIVSTEYQGKGTYKLVFSNYAKKPDQGDIIKKDSYFSIIDIIGRGYELDLENIKINDKNYNLTNDSINSDEGIIVDYEDHILYIDIPENLILKTQKLEFYITLVERDLYFEYLTSEDTYFNLVPSIDNDFYPKKDSQSYMMDGYGYIKLNKK